MLAFLVEREVFYDRTPGLSTPDVSAPSSDINLEPSSPGHDQLSEISRLINRLWIVGSTVDFPTFTR